MIKNELIPVVNFAQVGEAISHELAAKMVKDYQDANHAETARCYNIGKNIIEQILAQPGCVAMRFYNAIDETGKQTLVYAGVDEKGYTIMEYPTVNEDGKLGRVEAIIGDRATKETYSWFD